MTLNEELEMARLETASKFPALEVVVQDGSVYINFGFSIAVVLEPELMDNGRWWHAEVLEWAADHGVKDEVWIGTSQSLTDLLVLVDAWLRAYLEQEAKTQAIIDAMPTD